MKSGPPAGTLRIIGGHWRSRQLRFRAVDQLRPTANRIRETLFNWLQEKIAGESCLDLFAGSGACGIEALSRGAARVRFIENNPVAAADIRDNLALLRASNGQVDKADVMAWLEQVSNEAGAPYGIVFIDPPYAADLEIACCRKLEDSALLKPDALIYLETDKSLAAGDFPANWHIHRQKHAGAVNYYLLQREG